MGTYLQNEKRLRKTIGGLTLILLCGIDDSDGDFISAVVCKTTTVEANLYAGTLSSEDKWSQAGLEQLKELHEKIKKIKEQPLAKTEQVLVSTGFVKQNEEGEVRFQVKWLKLGWTSASMQMVVRSLDHNDIQYHATVDNFVANLSRVIVEFEDFEAKCRKAAPSIRII